MGSIFFASYSVAQQDLNYKVCYKDVCFKTEVMSTPAQREQGLMFRETLPEKQALLFEFEANGRFAFWMKNVKFPIDMIWIDENKTIVHIEANVPPCQKDPCQVYVPAVYARYVLEIPAGAAKDADMQPGGQFSFEINSLIKKN